MAKKSRSYRVPKKIAQQAAGALDAHQKSEAGLDDAHARMIAQALTSSWPVSEALPKEVKSFFTADWRYNREKFALAPFYGGEFGREWASRCLAILETAPVQPDLDEEYSVEELFEFTDDEMKAVLDFFKSLASTVIPMTETLSPATVAEGVAEHEDLPVVEEVAEEIVDLTTPEEEAEELALMHAALGDVVRNRVSLNEPQLQPEAEEARERMLSARRAKAMARMMQFQAGPAAPAVPVPAAEEEEGGEPPKA